MKHSHETRNRKPETRDTSLVPMYLFLGLLGGTTLAKLERMGQASVLQINAAHPIVKQLKVSLSPSLFRSQLCLTRVASLLFFITLKPALRDTTGDEP